VIYIYTPCRIKLFFWRRCRGGRRRLLQGEFRMHILYFVLVLLYFISACIISSKTQKELVPTIVVIFIGLLLSCFIMLSFNGWFP
jgi:hypothetical protein